MKIQAARQNTMAEIRKLLRLAKNAYAVTIPAQYRKHLKFGPGNYVSIWLLDTKTLAIRKHEAPGKI